jgi:hypothetical protein
VKCGYVEVTSRVFGREHIRYGLVSRDLTRIDDIGKCDHFTRQSKARDREDKTQSGNEPAQFPETERHTVYGAYGQQT